MFLRKCSSTLNGCTDSDYFRKKVFQKTSNFAKRSIRYYVTHENTSPAKNMIPPAIPTMQTANKTQITMTLDSTLVCLWRSPRILSSSVLRPNGCTSVCMCPVGDDSPMICSTTSDKCRRSSFESNSSWMYARFSYS